MICVWGCLCVGVYVCEVYVCMCVCVFGGWGCARSAG